jgi:hypothetical protein
MLQAKTLLFSIITLLISANLLSQNRDMENKSPVEIAAMQAEKLQRDLNLEDYQVFLVDSVLQTNIAGSYKEFEKMKSAGIQSTDSYRELQLRWRTKTEDAFMRFMTIEQFERYLKISGIPKKERAKIMKRYQTFKGSKN